MLVQSRLMLRKGSGDKSEYLQIQVPPEGGGCSSLLADDWQPGARGPKWAKLMIFYFIFIEL